MGTRACGKVTEHPLVDDDTVLFHRLQQGGLYSEKQGSWYLTPEGEEAIKLGAEQILRNANAAYRKWKQEQDLDEDYAVEEETLEKETIINIEQLEEQANEGIRQYIKAKILMNFKIWWRHCYVQWVTTRRLLLRKVVMEVWM